MVAPSSVDRPTTARPRWPRHNPLGYDGSSPGTASSAVSALTSALVSNRWRRHTPNSLPPVSSNHQTHSPSGSLVPTRVPGGRAVLGAVDPSDRSQRYISNVPLALLTNT